MGPNSTNNGADNPVNAFAMNGTSNLFVGGSFTVVGGSISANNVASWDGISWDILGNSTNNGIGGGTFIPQVEAFAINSRLLFIGGDFSLNAGEICSPFITSYGKMS